MKFYVRIGLKFFPLIILICLAMPCYAVEKNGTEQKAKSNQVLKFTDYKNLKGAELVRMVQLTLRDSGIDPGPIDGILGPKTHEAIKKFQIKNDLEPTGEIDKPTKDLLFWSF